eukprot:s3310_g14.t1
MQHADIFAEKNSSHSAKQTVEAQDVELATDIAAADPLSSHVHPVIRDAPQRSNVASDWTAGDCWKFNLSTAEIDRT